MNGWYDMASKGGQGWIMSKDQTGFTILEAVVVTFCIAVLATLLFILTFGN